MELDIVVDLLGELCLEYLKAGSSAAEVVSAGVWVTRVLWDRLQEQLMPLTQCHVVWTRRLPRMPPRRTSLRRLLLVGRVGPVAHHITILPCECGACAILRPGTCEQFPEALFRPGDHTELEAHPGYQPSSKRCPESGLSPASNEAHKMSGIPSRRSSAARSLRTVPPAQRCASRSGPRSGCRPSVAAARCSTPSRRDTAPL